MKKYFSSIVLLLLITAPSILTAESSKGLNVMLTSADNQTQMMAMVLSMKTLKQNKKVRVVLCSNAGDLAVKGIKSPKLKPMDKSPKMLLKGIIKNGAEVKICPLYLPNASKDKSVLLEGITVAKPATIAKNLLDKNYSTLSY